MARIRTIKPEFFTSEDIVALSPHARLLYIALWCEADKEGRMTWKPNTFKLRYLPGDAVDIQVLATELVQSGLVVLYGDGYAVIPKFRLHQHINPRESDSQLPEPDASASGLAQTGTRAARVGHASARVDDAQGGREGKGKEGDIGAIAPVADKAATPPAGGLPKVPIDQVLSAYHEILPDLPQARIMDDRRRKAIASFWRWVLTSKKTDGTPRAACADEAVEWTRAYFARASENDFLMGRGTRSAGHENWRCDLEFLLSEKGRRHVIEKTGGQA
jgi:hypothetical protein